jgi:hypothetical protein
MKRKLSVIAASLFMLAIFFPLVTQTSFALK